MPKANRATIWLNNNVLFWVTLIPVVALLRQASDVAASRRGAALPITSEMWVIRRGSYFVLVGTTYPPDNTAANRAAVMKVVNSVQLTN